MSKRKRYEEELNFRLQFSEMFGKINDRMNSCFYNNESDQVRMKLCELSEAWNDMIRGFLIEAEVEEGIVRSYHPLEKMPESMENYQKMVEKVLKDLEGRLIREMQMYYEPKH
jgi:hypothetical protein